LANALINGGSGAGATGATGANSLLANLSSALIAGGGAATSGVNEKQLANDLAKEGQGGTDDAAINDRNNPEATSKAEFFRNAGSFVMVSFAEAFRGSSLALTTSFDAEQVVVSEIAHILDKVLPILVPTEFENSVENILTQTASSILEEGKSTLTKVGNTLADLAQAKITKNLPALQQPAKNKVEKIKSEFEFIITGITMVDTLKENKVTENPLFEDGVFIRELSSDLETMIAFTSMDRASNEESLLNNSTPTFTNEQSSKFKEAIGVIAGAMLAPGILAATNGPIAPVVEKPKNKSRKRNS